MINPSTLINRTVFDLDVLVAAQLNLAVPEVENQEVASYDLTFTHSEEALSLKGNPLSGDSSQDPESTALKSDDILSRNSDSKQHKSPMCLSSNLSASAAGYSNSEGVLQLHTPPKGKRKKTMLSDTTSESGYPAMTISESAVTSDVSELYEVSNLSPESQSDASNQLLAEQTDSIPHDGESTSTQALSACLHTLPQNSFTEATTVSKETPKSLEEYDANFNTVFSHIASVEDLEWDSDNILLTPVADSVIGLEELTESSSSVIRPPYLDFESRFESGNLRKAIQVN